MNQPYYAYCPNPECAHRQGQPGIEWEHRTYAVQTESADLAGQFCPHCQSELRATCQKCGKALQDRPQNFCPACGASLFLFTTVTPCRICGRPVTSSATQRKEVPVCSEHCLRILIQQQVRVCDQCGTRFMADPHLQDEPDGQERMRSDTHRAGEPLGDFCSSACRTKFLAALKR
jgi:hypothetical protein